MTEDHQLTEKKIFDAATEIFEEKGMAGARMQDIADRAGINKALLHYYFRSKEKLFSAVFDKLAQKMFTRFAGIFELDMPLDEKIEYFFREHISFLRKNPGLPVFILGESKRNPELLDKFLANVNFENIKKATGTATQNTESDILFAHIMVTVISLSVFPVAARPILEKVLSSQGISYDDFLDERIKYSSELIKKVFADNNVNN